VIIGLFITVGGFFATHSVAIAWVSARSATLGAKSCAVYAFCPYLGSSIGGTIGRLVFSAARSPRVNAYNCALVLTVLFIAIVLGRPRPVARKSRHALPLQAITRYEDNGAAIVVVAAFAEPGIPDHAVGDRLTTEGDNLSSTVWRTHWPARRDSWDGAAGSIAAHARVVGLRSRVGAPIVVNDRVWGMAVVGNSAPNPLPPDIEERVAEFAGLAATAINAATTRAELIASRARIVAAADDARRRIERDLHDGAQQRLVALALKARMAMDQTPAELDGIRAELSYIARGLTTALEEIREISHGIHPAILSSSGLGAALKTLTRRAAVPVTVDVAIQAELPDAVEVAAYYVTAEAVANAAKHAHASQVSVRARIIDETLRLSIRDDGIGGADSAKGSGIIGLNDRIDVLGGKLTLNSPVGSGTAIDVTIPLALPPNNFSRAFHP